MGKIDLIQLLYTIPCVLIALTFHEFAHGWVAMKLGDPTARNYGRLSLNPLKHLDPIGTVCMVLFKFGWAKPVPVNTRYFKKPRRDMALVAAAGPAMNLILSFLGLLVCHILLAVFNSYTTSSSFLVTVENSAVELFYYFHIYNLALCLFNLFPIPPLDGSRIFLVWLPTNIYFAIMKYERYIQIGLLVLLWTGILSFPLGYAMNAVSNGMTWLIKLVPFLR